MPVYESLFIHEMVELENENCCVTPLAPLLIIIIIISLSLTLSPPASFTHPSNLNNRRHCLLTFRRRCTSPAHRRDGWRLSEREKDRDKELWQMNKNDIGISLGKPPRHHHLLYEPFLKFKS